MAPRQSYWDIFVNYAQALSLEDIERIPDDTLKRAAMLLREQPMSITTAAERLGVAVSTLSKKVKAFVTSGQVPQHVREEAENAGKVRGRSSSGGGGGGRGSPIQFRSGMSDMELIEQIVRARLEAKYPIAYKMVKDMSWFANTVFDMGIVSTILALKNLPPGSQPDFSDPEKTVKVLSSVLEEMAERAAKAEEMEQRVRELERELAETRRQLVLIQAERDAVLAKIERVERALEQARETIESLSTMVETLTRLVEERLGGIPTGVEVEAYA